MESSNIRLLRLKQIAGNENIQSYGTEVSESRQPDQSDDPTVEERPEKSKWHHFLGIFLAAILGLLYTCMSFFSKYLQDRSATDLSLMFSIGSIIFALPLVITTGDANKGIDKKFFILIFIYGALIAFSTTFRFTAIKMLPLGEASAIVFGSPLFTALFSRILLKEKIHRVTMAALVVSFFGLLLVAKLPVIIIDSIEGNRFGSFEHSIGCVYAFSSVILTSLRYVTGRKLRYANNWTVTLTQGVVSAIVLAAVSPATSGISLRGDCSYRDWMFLGVGAYGFVVTVLLFGALKYEDSVVVSSIVVSTDILSSFLVQCYFFKDPIDVYSCVGAILVFVSGMILPFRKWVVSLPQESRIKQKLKWMEK